MHQDNPDGGTRPVGYTGVKKGRLLSLKGATGADLGMKDLRFRSLQLSMDALKTTSPSSHKVPPTTRTVSIPRKWPVRPPSTFSSVDLFASSPVLGLTFSTILQIRRYVPYFVPTSEQQTANVSSLSQVWAITHPSPMR